MSEMKCRKYYNNSPLFHDDCQRIENALHIKIKEMKGGKGGKGDYFLK
jgi:hypothetical protein